jgi:hypothetical protein
MSLVSKILAAVGICMACLFTTSPALAIPSLPASYYGMVKINDANVPDGTLIQALISGQVFAEVQTQTYQGDSVYTLDIPGDDPDTTVMEGGQDNDTIIFTIGGLEAVQTSPWKSGTNINLDLGVSTSATMQPPQETTTPMPAWTATSDRTQAATTPTARFTTTASTGNKTQETPGKSTSMIGFGTPGLTDQPTINKPSPTISSATDPEDTSSSFSKTIVVSLIIVGSILSAILWFLFFRKPKVWK